MSASDDARRADAAPETGDGAGASDGLSASPDFAVEIGVFAGPLDLLLHLIESRELDITAVSLLAVTEQYMEHLRSAERINMAALAQFIGVGARLLLLKSRALLPHDDEAAPATDDEGDAEDLLRALEEYRRFKSVAGQLREREEAGRAYRREAAPPPVPPGTGLDRVTLETLQRLFREVLERLPAEEPRSAAAAPPPRIRLADRVQRLAQLLAQQPRLSFRALVSGATSRTIVVVDFMAVLELIKARYLQATQADTFGDIDLERVPGAELPALTTLAAIEDVSGEG